MCVLFPSAGTTPHPKESSTFQGLPTLLCAGGQKEAGAGEGCGERIAPGVMTDENKDTVELGY